MEALHQLKSNSIIAQEGMQSRTRPGEEAMARIIVHEGRKIRVAIDESPGPGGQIIRRDMVLHPGAVAILPVIDAGHVCLLRNHRPIVGETLWEIPAGTLEPNEPVEQAAVRELAEETGYRAGRWRKLHTFFPSPGVLSERTWLFLAEDLTPGAMRLEADEQIEPQVVTWQQALSWCLDGTIRDAKTLVALLLWQQMSART
jgi:ADP-ribose pyrophosphatase